MKVFVVLNLLVLLGLSLALPTNERENELVNTVEKKITHKATHRSRRALKRMVRDAFGGAGIDPDEIKSTIIESCRSNGYSYDLQDTFSDMKLCFQTLRVISSNKAELLANIDDCAAEAIRQTTNCLPEDQKYFPEFLLELVKSSVGFVHDDIDLIHGVAGQCLANLGPSASVKFNRCVANNLQGDLNQIPPSKEAMCNEIIYPTVQCYPNLLRENCDTSEQLHKFIDDFIIAMETPCQS